MNNTVANLCVHVCRIVYIVCSVYPYECALHIEGIQKPFVYRVRFSSKSDVASIKRALILSFRLPVGRTPRYEIPFYEKFPVRP